MRKILLPLLVACALGAVLVSVQAQSASRMFGTLSANLTNGTSTPITCTQSGNGCFLDVTVAGGAATFADGTSGAPSIAFASEPTLGFFRQGSANMQLQGTLTATGGFVSGNFIFPSAGRFSSAADANFVLQNNALTIGSRLKADALPTVASGFGTAPAITAGSTPLAGSVNVGTGGVATSGVINFNGTAFPSAPFVTCMNTTTAAVLRCTSTTTQLTVTAPAAFTASDVVAWVAISPK